MFRFFDFNTERQEEYKYEKNVVKDSENGELYLRFKGHVARAIGVRTVNGRSNFERSRSKDKGWKKGAY